MINIHNVTVSLSGRAIINDANLSISTGEIAFLVGENGAGKTTLLKAVLGDLPVQAGTINALRCIPQRDRHVLLRKTGVVLAETTLPPDLQIRDIYQLCLEAHKINKPGDVYEDLAERFSISRHWNRYAGTLSSGESRKIMIAFSLLHEPNLLIFDEVNNFLDPLAKMELKLFLQQFVKKPDRSVFFATHDYSLFFIEGARIHVLSEGKIHSIPIEQETFFETKKAISSLEKSIRDILR